MNFQQKHDALVNIIRKIKGEPSLKDSVIEGELILDEHLLSDVKALDEEGVINDLKIEGETIRRIARYSLPEGENPSVFISLFYNSCSVYRDFDEFLENNSNRYREPKSFYIIEGNIESGDTEPHELLKKYRDAVSFIDLLAQLSDAPNVKRAPENIFFSGATSREILPMYVANDLVEFPGLKEFKKQLLTSVHSDEKRGIFKTSLLDILSAESDGDHLLSVVFSRYDVLRRNFLEAYHVYIQEFSAKEVIDEVETNNLELANRLHSVIVDMNKSIFALPIALIFAATRFDSSELFLFKNTVVIVCSWMALGIFFLNLAAHKRTLNFVSEEIEKQRAKAEKYFDLRDRLLPPYDNLLRRCQFQKVLRILLGTFLWLVFILLTVIYIYYFCTSYHDVGIIKFYPLDSNLFFCLLGK